MGDLRETRPAQGFRLSWKDKKYDAYVHFKNVNACLVADKTEVRTLDNVILVGTGVITLAKRY